MTTTNSTELANAALTPITFNPAHVRGGKVRIFRASVTFASQAAADIINLIKAPKGSRILWLHLKPSVTMGAAATWKIGDAADDDKLRVAAVITVSEFSAFALAGIGATDALAVEGTDAVFTAETNIFATVAAASMPSSGRLIADFALVID